jgi:hypothetical protein
MKCLKADTIVIVGVKDTHDGAVIVPIEVDAARYYFQGLIIW